MAQGININKSTRKMLTAVLFLIMGVSMIFYGILDMVIEDHSQKTLSDSEIRTKARELGMVEVKEAFTKALEESEKKE